MQEVQGDFGDAARGECPEGGQAGGQQVDLFVSQPDRRGEHGWGPVVAARRHVDIEIVDIDIPSIVVGRKWGSVGLVHARCGRGIR